MKKYLYEMFGTFILVLFGCGTVSFLGDKCSIVIAALSFGFVYLFGYYVLRHVCPCFFNPVLALVSCMDKKTSIKQCLLYILFEFIGAFLGIIQIFILVTLTNDIAPIASSLFDANVYADLSRVYTPVWCALVLEIILSCILVFVFLSSRLNTRYSSYLGIILAITYAVVVALGYCFSGGSANPARSFAPASFLTLCEITLPFEQYWVFLLGPVVGALLAFVIYKFVYVKWFKKASSKNTGSSKNDVPASKINKSQKDDIKAKLGKELAADVKQKEKTFANHDDNNYELENNKEEDDGSQQNKDKSVTNKRIARIHKKARKNDK